MSHMIRPNYIYAAPSVNHSFGAYLLDIVTFEKSVDAVNFYRTFYNYPRIYREELKRDRKWTNVKYHKGEVTL